MSSVREKKGEKGKERVEWCEREKERERKEGREERVEWYESSGCDKGRVWWCNRGRIKFHGEIVYKV